MASLQEEYHEMFGNQNKRRRKFPVGYALVEATFPGMKVEKLSDSDTDPFYSVVNSETQKSLGYYNTMDEGLYAEVKKINKSTQPEEITDYLSKGFMETFPIPDYLGDGFMGTFPIPEATKHDIAEKMSHVGVGGTRRKRRKTNRKQKRNRKSRRHR